MNSIQEIVEQFSKNIEIYKSGEYDEANTRSDFIDKFFMALGWDIYNDKGLSESLREVVREDKVYIRNKPKAPDYSFRLGGVRKYFVEAKRPSVNIKEDIKPAYQVRRYGYTARLPISVLTDFEELSIYDTTIKPKATDNASVARIFYCNFKDYAKKDSEIRKYLSRESIISPDYIERLGLKKKKKKGSEEVDRGILDMIAEWRLSLARALYKDSRFTKKDLNTVIQLYIDRIMFLRIAEDRGTEPYGKLKKIASGKATNQIKALFKDAQKKYNSDIFQTNTALDSVIDIDKTLADIVGDIYYPECPYEFSVLPIEILGIIYEKFLGNTVEIDDGKISIVSKIKTRKDKGIYYTPPFIVKQMVGATLRKKITGMRTEEIKKLKILDPACGSGSFLIGIYDCLMEQILKNYTKDDATKRRALKLNKVYEYAKDEYKLTISEKQDILLNCVFGVDIDFQAVEVSKLSLLLKMMENETLEAEGQLFKHSDLKILPNLSGNIKCGNSLIDDSYYSGKNLNIFSDEEIDRINTFNWAEENKDIFESGGFDFILGNPPYINAIELNKILRADEKEHLKEKYESAKGAVDIYIYFLEKCYGLCKANSEFALITPNKWLAAPYGEAIRKIMADRCRLFQVDDYSRVQVFEDPSVYPIVTYFQKSAPTSKYQIDINRFKDEETSIATSCSSEVIRLLPESIWGLLLSDDANYVLKIYKKGKLLENLAEVQATSTAAEADEYSNIIYENRKGQKYCKIVNTGTIKKYYFVYGKSEMTNKGKKYSKPMIDLSKVSKLRKKIYLSPKIIFSKMALEIEGSIDHLGEYASINTNCIYEIKKDEIEFFALGAIINSNKLSYIYSQVFSPLIMSGGYFQFQAPQMRIMPIVIPDEKDQSDLSRMCREIVQILEKSDSDNDASIKRKNILVSQINHIVDRLY